MRSERVLVGSMLIPRVREQRIRPSDRRGTASRLQGSCSARGRGPRPPPPRTVRGRGQFGEGCANQRVNITQSSSVLRMWRLSIAQHCYERSSRPLARRWAVDFPEACGARESSANISTEPPAERPFAAPAPPQRTWRARRGSNHARSSRYLLNSGALTTAARACGR